MNLPDYDTRELLDELGNRFPDLLFVGTRDLSVTDDGEEEFYITFRGGITTVLGMLVRAEMRVKAALVEDDQADWNDDRGG